MGFEADDGFDEDELRAALQMSMEQQGGGDSQHDVPAVVCHQQWQRGQATAEPAGAVSIETKPTVEPPEITIESRELENFDALCKIMFNDSITTTDDKERWIYECITTASMEGDASNSTTETYPRQSHLDMLTRPRHEGDSSKDAEDAKPAAVPDSIHRLWGLTQKHGGPCGILAAMQAEMIRLLLFGRDHPDCQTSDLKLFYPFNAAQDRHGTSDPITANCVKRALAMAIGMILARAAIMPPASNSEKQPSKRDDVSVYLVLPDQDKKQQPVEKSDDENADKLTSEWVSRILHPGAKSNDTSPAKTTLGLKEYVITCPKLDLITSPQLDPNEHVDDNSSPESKRRKKKKGVTFATDSNTTNDPQEEKLSPERKQQQHQMELLALSLAHILLGLPIPIKGEEGDTTTPSIALDEYKTSSSVPLDCFCRPGGVMFFVMSLIQSRGLDVIKNGEIILLFFRVVIIVASMQAESLIILLLKIWMIQILQSHHNLDILARS